MYVGDDSLLLVARGFFDNWLLSMTKDTKAVQSKKIPIRLWYDIKGEYRPQIFLQIMRVVGMFLHSNPGATKVRLIHAYLLETPT